MKTVSRQKVIRNETLRRKLKKVIKVNDFLLAVSSGRLIEGREVIAVARVFILRAQCQVLIDFCRC
jgi:hypothetical protein